MNAKIIVLFNHKGGVRVSFEDEKVNLYRTAINRYSSELSEYK